MTSLAVNLAALARRLVGIAANNLVALDANGKLPPVDGSRLTGLRTGWDFVAEDQEAAGISGGAATAATWNARVLNTVVQNTIEASVSSNSFALPAGKYEIEFDGPAYYVGRHRVKLRNETDGTDVSFGTSEFSVNSGGGIVTRSFGSTTIIIASTKTFKIYHYTETSRTLDGLGVNATAAGVTGVVEVFTRVRVRKLA